MRAGLAFVIAALLVGQGFREWKRGHETVVRDLILSLEAEDARARPDTPPPSDSSAARDVPPLRARRHTPDARVGRIDPSRAPVSELVRLPGIGPSLAARIVADRDQHGAFKTPEALMRVRGIGPKTLDRIRAFLSFPGADGGDSLTGF
ncbi:MAG TPA: helix-hairpin-helix domain-containing protein [Candidatus Polarisedimenticolia bacterium]|nr:helix-hairpin-helix domain-containing protein [Candidatus Polarisedimenticolia bacterium]